jgi:hypothetical protein
LSNKFQNTDPTKLDESVANLNPVGENLTSALSVAEIQHYLTHTESLLALVFECPEKAPSDKSSDLTSQWFLGSLRGELDTVINVKARFEFVDYKDANGLHNLLALYALAMDAQRSGNIPSAIRYLSVAHTAAACKLKSIDENKTLQRDVYEERIKHMGDRNERERLQQTLDVILEESQRARTPVVTTRYTIKTTLERLGVEAPIPKCTDQ